MCDEEEDINYEEINKELIKEFNLPKKIIIYTHTENNGFSSLVIYGKEVFKNDGQLQFMYLPFFNSHGICIADIKNVYKSPKVEDKWLDILMEIQKSYLRKIGYIRAITTVSEKKHIELLEKHNWIKIGTGFFSLETTKLVDTYIIDL